MRAPRLQSTNWLVAAIATIVMLDACAQLGLATPKGFDQSLAEAYGTHTAVVSATVTALIAGTITSAEAAAVQKQAIAVRETLDAAKEAEQLGNTTAANNDLTLAVTGLTALQSYLNNQGKK